MRESDQKIRLVQHSWPRMETTAPPSEAGFISIAHRDTPPGLLRHNHNQEELREDDGEIFLPQSVYRKIMEHLSSDTARELGGLLVGTEIQLQGSRPGILVQDALPARHTRSHETRLTFTEDTWAELDRELDALEASGAKLQRVGWYHSHPGMGIFLSDWDLDVCQEFRRPTHLALVIDPVEPKGGFFIRGTEGFRKGSPQGFWEIRDLTPESVVRWRDLTPGPELPRGALGLLTPGDAHGFGPTAPRAQQEASPAQVDIQPAPVPPPVSTSHPYPWMHAAVLFLPVLMMAALWWDREDRNAWMERNKETLKRHDERLAHQSDAISALETRVTELIKHQEQTPDPPPPTQVVKPGPESPPTPPVKQTGQRGIEIHRVPRPVQQEQRQAARPTDPPPIQVQHSTAPAPSAPAASPEELPKTSEATSAPAPAGTPQPGATPLPPADQAAGAALAPEATPPQQSPPPDPPKNQGEGGSRQSTLQEV